MGYFETDAEYMAYRRRVCARCAHEVRDDNAEKGCPVQEAHLIHYSVYVRNRDLRDALNELIPRGNGQCNMFHEREASEKEG